LSIGYISGQAKDKRQEARGKRQKARGKRQKREIDNQFLISR
jgi:uncharacterized protein YjbJ (UPF0337 family)